MEEICEMIGCLAALHPFIGKAYRKDPKRMAHSLYCACAGAVSRASESTRLTSLFGSFAFLQFAVLGLANHAGEGYLTPVQRDRVYYALQVFVILGYLLYSLFHRFFAGKRVRTAILRGVFILFPACTAWMLFASTDSLLNVIVSMTAALCLGGIGGAAHLRMSMATVRGAKTARSMGLGSAAAVVLQYLLQIHWGVTLLLPAFLLAAFLLLLLTLRYRAPAQAVEKAAKPEITPRRRLLFSVLISATFIFFSCFYNESIHHLMSQSGYVSANVYSWPRLMLVPGYLLFALIGDRKNGKYVPIASLCIMLTALLNVVLIGNAGTYLLNMCLFYCVIAAFTSYYLLTFWRLAPGTGHPAFWAPFGRMLDSAMVLFTGIMHLSAISAPVVLGMDIAGVAAVIMLMAVSGNFNFSSETAVAHVMPETENAAEPSETETAVPSFPTTMSPEEALSRMKERFGLTPRETEVLRELVQTEDIQVAISDRLSIRVKTLQDYVTRLYRKTGVSTRAGLTALYHEAQNRE